MLKKNQKTIDTKGIVELFGGKHQIVSDYEKILKAVITVKAVEKWIERQSIQTQHILNLQTIAEKRGLQFSLNDFIKTIG